MWQQLWLGSSVGLSAEQRIEGRISAVWRVRRGECCLALWLKHKELGHLAAGISSDNGSQLLLLSEGIGGVSVELPRSMVGFGVNPPPWSPSQS